MALLNNNNEYIIINKDNEYLVYEDQKSRDIIKNGTSSQTIINKYLEILNDLDNKIKSDPNNKQLVNKYLAYFDEYANYSNDLRLLDGNKHIYPLMNKYFMYVELTIPKIKEKGKINLKGDNLTDKYNYAKSKKFFGKTLDI